MTGLMTMENLLVENAQLSNTLQILFTFGGISRSGIEEINGLPNEFLACISIHGAGGLIAIHDWPGSVGIMWINEH